MSRVRLRISMSLDGFVAGPSQSVDNPLGIGGMRLHQWVFPLSVWRAMHGLEGGGQRKHAGGRGIACQHRRVGDKLHGLELVRTVAAPQMTHFKFVRR